MLSAVRFANLTSRVARRDSVEDGWADLSTAVVHNCTGDDVRLPLKVAGLGRCEHQGNLELRPWGVESGPRATRRRPAPDAQPVAAPLAHDVDSGRGLADDEAGGELDTAGTILGHSSPNTTAIYAEAGLRKAAAFAMAHG